MGTQPLYGPHAPLCEWWNIAADHFGRHCYTSIAAYKLESEFGGNDENGWSEVAAQVDLARTYTKNNSAGQIFYNTQSINGPMYVGLGDYLGENSYATKSLVPVVDWKEHPTYPAVSSLTDNNGELTWDTAERQGRAIIRYTVYAVPEDVTYEAALSPDGDGLDAKYLVDVTYATSFALPANKAKGYWYAVCVYDGYGFESQPAFVNYKGSGVMAVTEDASIHITVSGNVVSFDRTARYATVYNVAGVEIMSAASVQTLTLPSAGVYIINADGSRILVQVR